MFGKLTLCTHFSSCSTEMNTTTAWWEGSEILGGRDEVAGGTWLACLRRARVAFLTNVMELHTLPDAKSRGDLPLRFVESTKSLREFAEEVVEEAHQYNGFNLIIADLSSETWFMSPTGQGGHKEQRLEQSFRELLSEYAESEIPMNEMVEN
ncbi:unnamed protein product [Camellia sinensis]